jgi:hypothetical protein
MSFETKEVVLTIMLGDHAVARERGYRAVFKPSGEGDSCWLETSESSKVACTSLEKEILSDMRCYHQLASFRVRR